MFSNTYLVSGGWVLLNANDFESIYFPSGWDELFDEHGQGFKVHYPVKVRHFLSWSPQKFIADQTGTMIKANRACLEKLSVNMIKVAGGVQ